MQMNNPLRIFFEWIEQESYSEQMHGLAECLVRYFPGYLSNAELDTVDDLISFCKKENSPAKIYGMSLFIHTFTQAYIKRSKGVAECLKNSKPWYYDLGLEMEKSWLELEKEYFNPPKFDEYLSWVLEEESYGEENTRVKKIWGSS
jgi:hypothetical protein